MATTHYIKELHGCPDITGPCSGCSFTGFGGCGTSNDFSFNQFIKENRGKEVKSFNLNGVFGGAKRALIVMIVNREKYVGVDAPFIQEEFDV